MRLKAVIFDFDGTLTKQGSINFNEIKKNIHCPADQYILDYIGSLNDKDKISAREKLDYFEFKAAEKSIEEDFAQEIINFLKRKNIPVIIITRNSKNSVLRALKNFENANEKDFYKIISRDDHFPVKPDPSSIIHIADLLNIECSQICMIGDYIHDIAAGQNAGTVTIYKKTNRKEESEINSDYTISSLRELPEIFKKYLPLKAGKYPNNLLKELISNFTSEAPSVLIGPGVGEDTAALDICKEQVIVVKSDPITFTTNHIGTYAVNINLNDMATSGATPRWMTIVLIMPIGTYPDQIQNILKEISDLCRTSDISICGGHTEISEAVNRPILSCTVLGTVNKKNLINKKSVHRGDSIILTKSIGLEGTAIIANDCYKRLLDGGINKKTLELSKDFIHEISIVNEAETALNSGRVSALHDVTEGGIATALSELSSATGKGFSIDMSSIPIRKETIEICSYFNIDPMGLISSGSLIVICSKEDTEIILSSLRCRNISAAIIGFVNSDHSGITTINTENSSTWPEFETDEISKIFK